MRFSERLGVRPVKDIVQLGAMDAELRIRLWNVLSKTCWKLPRYPDSLSVHRDLNDLITALWHNHFKWPTDTIPWRAEEAIARVRKYYFDCEWHAAYDLLEFVAGSAQGGTSLIWLSNQVLQEELSGYRFVDGRLTPIASQEQARAVERAVGETASLFPSATEHLRTAIDLLAQKPSPDYRNSIKESISAVESLCVAMTGDSKATLGKALKAISGQAELHGALRDAFEKLYGYTSDASGIRHALLEEDRLEQEDAVFMLVACSAFVSYVIAKRARKA